MQEKQVKTWDDRSLALIWFLLEAIAIFATWRHPAIAFLAAGLLFPFWAFVASFICTAIPFLHWATFTLYRAEVLPEHRIYHILKADSNGYILYKETERPFLNCWLIDNPVDKKTVEEIWNGI